MNILVCKTFRSIHWFNIVPHSAVWLTSKILEKTSHRVNLPCIPQRRRFRAFVSGALTRFEFDAKLPSYLSAGIAQMPHARRIFNESRLLLETAPESPSRQSDMADLYLSTS